MTYNIYFVAKQTQKWSKLLFRRHLSYAFIKTKQKRAQGRICVHQILRFAKTNTEILLLYKQSGYLFKYTACKVCKFSGKIGEQHKGTGISESVWNQGTYLWSGRSYKAAIMSLSRIENVSDTPIIFWGVQKGNPADVIYCVKRNWGCYCTVIVPNHSRDNYNRWQQKKCNCLRLHQGSARPLKGL